MNSKPLKVRIKDKLRQDGILSVYSTKRLAWMVHHSITQKIQSSTLIALEAARHAPTGPYIKEALVDEILAERMTVSANLLAFTSQISANGKPMSYKDAFRELKVRFDGFPFPNYAKIFSRHQLNMSTCLPNKSGE